MKVEMIEGVPHVSSTDVRRDFMIIYEKVLKKYPLVVVERNGRPVCHITRPNPIQETVERF